MLTAIANLVANKLIVWTILQIGDSALHLAVKEGRVVNAALLIDNGADVNARSEVHKLVVELYAYA